MIDQRGRLVDSRSYADWMTPSTTPEQLEQELRTAQLHGRWLSDEELAALDEDKRQQIQDQAHRNQLRLRLIVLTGVSLLIPPLWPLAIGLTLYLLFPSTTRRLGLAAGLVLVAAAIGAAGLLAILTVWGMSLLF